MPRLQLCGYPTTSSGTRRGALTPTAMVAETTWPKTCGRRLKSKFWATTAVFVVEDDAQNGSDHVDARTVALVGGP